MNKNPLKILITGDFCPINRTEELVSQNRVNEILGNFSDVFSDNDLVITDLECPLTSSSSARKKIGPHQKADPSCITILKDAGIGLVAMANNHIMDYGHSGALDTINLCKQNGIGTVGVGKSFTEASSPYLFVKNGERVAILNYADDEFITAPDGSMRCNVLNSVNAFYDIRRAKESNDYIIVIVHGGNEFYELPSPRIKQLYRYLIDNGADAVVAHHTHTFSGYEVYNTKPIFYGLGNFVYDWPGKRDLAWNQGYVVKLTLSDSIHFKIIPLTQNNDKPGVFHLNDSESEYFKGRLEYLNSIIADDIKLDKKFNSYINSVTPMYDAYIEPYFGSVISSLRNRGFFPKLMSRRKRMLLLNIIRCESHREVVLGILEKSAGQKEC